MARGRRLPEPTHCLRCGTPGPRSVCAPCLERISRRYERWLAFQDAEWWPVGEPVPAVPAGAVQFDEDDDLPF